MFGFQNSIAVSAVLVISLTGFLNLIDSTEAASKKSPKTNNVQHLPSYIKRACSRNDPKVEECVMKIGQDALKSVVKGDPKYKIPNLDPMVIDELKIQEGTKQVGLKIVCKKCLLYGLPNAKFVKAVNDWDKRTCSWGFRLDKVEVRGKYNVSGQVLLLPIFGNGDAEFDMYNIDFTYVFHWEYYKVANWTYVNVTKSEMPMEIGNMTIKLENLFNGDKLLGGNMNVFINEHWREILKDIKPALSKSLAQIASSVLTNMAKVVPFDYLFPEKYDPNEPY